jgi:hypothetical protein
MSHDSGKDDVGFKKPPKHTQFRKGRSGNPKGRPKERKNFTTSLNALLNERMAVREGGKIRSVTKGEAIALRFVHEALNGNRQFLRDLTKLIPEFERLVQETSSTRPGGVLVVPNVTSMEDWERMSAEHARAVAERHAKESGDK